MHDSHIIKHINKTAWQRLVTRAQAPLFVAFSDKCYLYFKKVTGFKSPYKHTLRNFEGDILLSQKTLDEAYNYFSKASIKQIKIFKRNLIIHMNKLDKVSGEIENKDFSIVNSKELARQLKILILHTLYGTSFLNPMPAVDRALTERILNSLKITDEKQKQETLGILTYPFKENIHTEEEKDFYKLVSLRSNKDFRKLAEAHLAKYAWIGSRGYWLHRAWDNKFLLDRIKSFILQKKDSQKEFHALNKIRKDQKRKFEVVINKLSIRKSSEYLLILLAKEFAYLRTFRTDILYRSGFKARNLYYEIAKRAGLPPAEIVFFTDLEILAMAKTATIPISETELSERKKSFASFCDGIQFRILTGKKWTKVINKIQLSKPNSKDEIKGNVAFPGKTRGRVKVLRSSKDISKVKVGDILVATMTFPNFIPAMEKAAAFVTDEGGILCHAAIVSREMKKPCIIATKFATKVFKDGDMVEVDANKGVVRKI